MDQQITHTIGAVSNYLAAVDRRIVNLIQLAGGEQHVLKELRDAAAGYKKTLTTLTTTIRKPSFRISFLTDIKTENATVFAYITAVLLASINGIQKLELQLKKSKTTSGGIFSKKTRSVVVDDELGIYVERMLHYDQSLSVATHILECEIITSDPKLHIHNVKVHLQQLTNALSDLQTTNLNLTSVTPEKQSKANTTLTNFDGITSNAQELATMTLARTDSDMTKMHSGFVPMSPLIEVLTRNTLQPSVTIESVLDLEHPSNLPYENLSSEESTPNDSALATPMGFSPGTMSPGFMTPGMMTPGMMTPTNCHRAGIRASELHAELWKVASENNGSSN